MNDAVRFYGEETVVCESMKNPLTAPQGGRTIPLLTAIPIPTTHYIRRNIHQNREYGVGDINASEIRITLGTGETTTVDVEDV